MGSRKRQIIAAVLVLIAAGLWAHGLSGRPARRGLSGQPSQPSMSSMSSPSAAESNLPVPVAVDPEEVQPWGDNPFLDRRDVQPSTTAGGKQGLVLNGIIWDAQAPSAVINNRVLNSGDWIDQWQVVEIQKDRVVVSDGLTTRTLEVQ